ncbi:alpha-2-macroglobulin-like domain protein [Burkholderia pseudomallei]|nr:alpha-2-macroglobulin-like domain protein [Burkholderia pseudomallei]
MRLPMPAASHQMLASAERSSAGPFSLTTNTCRSSISRAPGRTATGNGPPVWNAKRRGPVTAWPAAERSVSLSATVQRTPGGRSFSKS